MADFHLILARAVAGLSDNSPRRAARSIERAKAALLAQLRGLDPPLSEAEIMRERLALDEARRPDRGGLRGRARASAGSRRPDDPPGRARRGTRLDARAAGSEFAPLPPAAGEDHGEPLPEPAEPQVARPRLLPPRERTAGQPEPYPLRRGRHRRRDRGRGHRRAPRSTSTS